MNCKTARLSFRAKAAGRSRGIETLPGREPSTPTIGIPRLRRSAAPLGMTTSRNDSGFLRNGRSGRRSLPNGRVPIHSRSATSQRRCKAGSGRFAVHPPNRRPHRPRRDDVRKQSTRVNQSSRTGSYCSAGRGRRWSSAASIRAHVFHLRIASSLPAVRIASAVSYHSMASRKDS